MYLRLLVARHTIGKVLGIADSERGVELTKSVEGLEQRLKDPARRR